MSYLQAGTPGAIYCRFQCALNAHLASEHWIVTDLHLVHTLTRGELMSMFARVGLEPVPHQPPSPPPQHEPELHEEQEQVEDPDLVGSYMRDLRNAGLEYFYVPPQASPSSSSTQSPQPQPQPLIPLPVAPHTPQLQHSPSPSPTPHRTRTIHRPTNPSAPYATRSRTKFLSGTADAARREVVDARGMGHDQRRARRRDNGKGKGKARAVDIKEETHDEGHMGSPPSTLHAQTQTGTQLVHRTVRVPLHHEPYALRRSQRIAAIHDRAVKPIACAATARRKKTANAKRKGAEKTGREKGNAAQEGPSGTTHRGTTPVFNAVANEQAHEADVDVDADYHAPSLTIRVPPARTASSRYAPYARRTSHKRSSVNPDTNARSSTETTSTRLAGVPQFSMYTASLLSANPVALYARQQWRRQGRESMNSGESDNEAEDVSEQDELEEEEVAVMIKQEQED